MTSATLTLTRLRETDESTLGVFDLYRDNEHAEFATLELLWRNNAENISRIPAGHYVMRWLWSAKHDCFCWHIIGVPQRDNIECHVGNFPRDTLGCVLLGEGVNHDGYLTGSRAAFDKFNTFLAGCTDVPLVITDP